MSTPSELTTRRVPPPCWTQEETLVLIEAYRDKWFSVNRGHLRSSDWNAVAATVNESSSANPPKSSLQCRHKIEKLRKRYRTEKQRCINYPGRFFSSWNLFPLLDSIAIGSSGNNKKDESNDIGDGFRVKTQGERYLVTPNNFSNLDQNLDPDLAFRARKISRIEQDSDSNISHTLGSGFYLKPVCDINSVSVAIRPKGYGGRVVSDYETGVPVKTEDTEMNMSFLPQAPKLKRYCKIGGDFNGDEGGDDAYVGFPVKTLGDVSQGFKPQNYRKIDRINDFNYRIETRNDKRDRFVAGNPIGGRMAPPPGFKVKGNCRIDGSSKLDANSKKLDGFGGDVNNTDIEGSSSGGKKALDPILEVVNAIKMSTKSFVKVEKMKMEMAIEIEKMRMEMMVKHNQMIMESHKQMVDAFANTILEKRNTTKKKKRNGKEVEGESLNEDKNDNHSQVAAMDCESIGKTTSTVKQGCEDVIIT